MNLLQGTWRGVVCFGVGYRAFSRLQPGSTFRAANAAGAITLPFKFVILIFYQVQCSRLKFGLLQQNFLALCRMERLTVQKRHCRISGLSCHFSRASSSAIGTIFFILSIWRLLWKFICISNVNLNERIFCECKNSVAKNLMNKGEPDSAMDQMETLKLRAYLFWRSSIYLSMR